MMTLMQTAADLPAPAMAPKHITNSVPFVIDGRRARIAHHFIALPKSNGQKRRIANRDIAHVEAIATYGDLHARKIGIALKPHLEIRSRRRGT